MTLKRSFLQSLLFGIAAGMLLAGINALWFYAANPSLLPVLLAFWWFIIFGISLWHAYLLSNAKLPATPRFSMQLLLAGASASVYLALQALLPGSSIIPDKVIGSPLRLQASLASELDVLISNPTIIVPAAFILCLSTSGLLYSILNRPSAK